jgi:transcriptional regulator with XRE-family HTH domain
MPVTEFSRRVRKLRYEAGLGPDDLADRAGISRTALYQVEAGRTTAPRAATVKRLADALGVKMEDLMGSEWKSPERIARERVPMSRKVGAIMSSSHAEELRAVIEKLYASLPTETTSP